MTIKFEGEDYSYDSLCAKDDGKCFSNKYIEPLGRILPSLANEQRRLAYPLEVLEDFVSELIS